MPNNAIHLSVTSDALRFQRIEPGRIVSDAQWPTSALSTHRARLDALIHRTPLVLSTHRELTMLRRMLMHSGGMPMWDIRVEHNVSAAALADDLDRLDRRYVPFDFVAIDYELANSSHASICSAGEAEWRGVGKPVPRLTYIAPPKGYDADDPFSRRIHRLSPDQWRDGVPTGDYFTDFATRTAGLVLVNHGGASSDISMMGQAYDAAKLGPRPALDLLDTCDMARRFLPDLPGHRLDTVFIHVTGQHEFADLHHDARADAIACASIVLRLAHWGFDVAGRINPLQARQHVAKRPRKR